VTFNTDAAQSIGTGTGQLFNQDQVHFKKLMKDKNVSTGST
jgi:hypothetical protein